MDEFKQYCDYVSLIAETLKLAGYNVVYFKHVNVIKLEYEGKTFYANTYPAFDLYSENIIFCKIKQFAWGSSISLGFSRGGGIDIKLTRNDAVVIYNESSLLTKRGVLYIREDMNIGPYMGRLYGMKYIDYKNKWVGGTDDTILNVDDFNAAESQTFNIANFGLKLVVSEPPTQIIGDSFTLFRSLYIANGKYMESGRDDIFKLVNEDGELFAQLSKPNEYSLTLASATRSIDPIHIISLRVLHSNNLYDGYELKNKYGEIINEPYVYRFNDIFFIITLGVEIYEARKPNSGKLTKPAAIMAE